MQEASSHRYPARASATLAPSLLRLSVAQRFVIAAVVTAVLWLAVAWALSSIAQ